MATHAAFMPGEAAAAPSGLWSWITTVDHKRIGILYGTSAFIFFLVGGIEALIMRLQLAAPDNTLVGAQRFNELFTMHGTTMVFLAIMPMSAAFFNYMIRSRSARGTWPSPGSTPSPTGSSSPAPCSCT